MKRDPVEVVRAIANALKVVPGGTELRVNDLATAAGIHWATASRYLELLSFAQKHVPTLRLEERAGISLALVSSNEWLDALSPKERVLVHLMAKRAFSVKNAVSVAEGQQKLAEELVEDGLARSTEQGDVYLSLDGARRAGTVMAEPFAELDADTPKALSTPTRNELEGMIRSIVLEELTRVSSSTPQQSPRTLAAALESGPLARDCVIYTEREHHLLVRRGRHRASKPLSQKLEEEIFSA